MTIVNIQQGISNIQQGMSNIQLNTQQTFALGSRPKLPLYAVLTLAKNLPPAGHSNHHQLKTRSAILVDGEKKAGNASKAA